MAHFFIDNQIDEPRFTLKLFRVHLLCSAEGSDIGLAGGAAGDLFSAAGDFAAAAGYSTAAKFAEKNARLTKIATGIEETRTERQAYLLIGAQQSAIAGAGFNLSGTALDLMKSSAQQASMDKALISNQGLIEENTYTAQAAQYRAQATAAKIRGIGGIVKGVAGFVAASDLRAKTDVRTSHYDAKGRRWVDFRYTWDGPDVVRHGVIAQEIMQSDPDAVGYDFESGFFTVDYSKLSDK